MIYSALHFLKEETNQFLRRELSANEDPVILGDIPREHQELPGRQLNKILFTLVHFMPEDMPKKAEMGAFPLSGVERMEINLLVSTTYTDYEMGLQQLSRTVDFLKQHPVFTKVDSPGMPAEISKITTFLIPLKIKYMYKLWEGLNGSYRPCALYKITCQASGEEEQLSLPRIESVKLEDPS